MALLGKLGVELKKDLMDFDAVGCGIEMGLPVCISAKANLHIDFAHIAVMHTQHCVLRRLLLSKSKQTCECGYDRTDLVLLCYLQLMVEKGLHMEKFQSVRVHVALSSSSPRMTQDLHDNNLNRA
jgi:hypothetical protein